MNQDLDDLLSAPMEELSAEPFIDSTMNALVHKQKAYVKIRQRVLWLCGIICITFVSLFNFSYSFSFTIQLTGSLPVTEMASKFTDLSTLFLDANTIFVIFCVAIIALVTISSETLANN